MKKLLGFLCASIGTLIVIPAMAADMRVKAPILKAPPPPVASWTGCYFDGGGGYGMWNQDEFTNLPPATSAVVTVGGRGWLGRVGGGCDYQIAPSFVIGVFGDYDFMDLTGTSAPPDTVGGGVFLVPGAANEKESSAWYVGGRLGYLVTPTLLGYVSGGYTQTRFDQQNLFGAVVGGPGFLNVSLPAHTFNGWFIGGGTEYALNLPFLPINGLFWRSEYRFAQYSSANLPFFTTSTGVPTGLFENEKKFVQTVTTSLVWRFNLPGLVTARY
jgi:outer membrane immunogenic protein